MIQELGHTPLQLGETSADVQFLEQRKDLYGHLVFACLVRAFDLQCALHVLLGGQECRALIQSSHIPKISSSLTDA